MRLGNNLRVDQHLARLANWAIGPLGLGLSTAKVFKIGLEERAVLLGKVSRGALENRIRTEKGLGICFGLRFKRWKNPGKPDESKWLRPMHWDSFRTDAKSHCRMSLPSTYSMNLPGGHCSKHMDRAVVNLRKGEER
jgi:hypothetical protein